MKRLRQRLTLLAAIRLAVGVIVACVLYDRVVGKSTLAGAGAIVGLLIFLVADGWFAGETETAIETANARIDELVRHGTRRDARIAALERKSGTAPPSRSPAPEARP
jgi:hypothetical protein